MTAPTRIAVLGFGDIAERAHVPILARIPGVRIAAVAEADPVRGAVAERTTGGPVFSSWEEALEAEADAALVSLPSALHSAVAEAALARGLHIYVEKPVALDVEEAMALVERWRVTGKVGMVGFNFRFNPLVRALRNQVAAGRVGRVLAVRSSFCSAAASTAGWRSDPRTGGGALWDLGIHHVDLVPFILGDPVAAAAATCDDPGREASVAAQLRTAAGVSVQCFFSQSSASEHRIEVSGSLGKLTVDLHGSTTPELLGPLGPAGMLLAALRGARSIVHPYRIRRHLAPLHEPSFHLALASFVRAVRLGRGTSPDLADGLRSVAVVEAVRSSARTGRETAVADRTEGGAVGSEP